MTVPAAIIVLAKTPVPGRVKTRCCPPCSPNQAADIAMAALGDTLGAACEAQRRRSVNAGAAAKVVLALDGEPGPWVPVGVEMIVQCDGSLGVRIDDAFASVGGPALLIGMDTPQVEVGTLIGALESLESGGCAGTGPSAVVGPSVDGGFWALGMTEPVHGLCAGVAMSRPDTCSSLLAALAEHGMAWSELPVLDDVDDFATACAVAAEVQASLFATAVDWICGSLDESPSGVWS